MGTLPDADTVAFEEHLLICAACRAAVEAADVYVRAMREAASELRRAG
jgi:anti-sigma factor RsiW